MYSYDFIRKIQQVRNRSTNICANLETEDYVVQPVVDVSPPKWHLGHTTWFWEKFMLKPYYETMRSSIQIIIMFLIVIMKL